MWPGIEPRSSGQFGNTLPTRPMSRLLIANKMQNIFYLIAEHSGVIKYCKLADCSQGQREGSLFNSYYTKVKERALLLSWDRFIYSWSVPYNAEC